jgi:hypothetical protein
LQFCRGYRARELNTYGERLLGGGRIELDGDCPEHRVTIRHPSVIRRRRLRDGVPEDANRYCVVVDPGDVEFRHTIHDGILRPIATAVRELCE